MSEASSSKRKSPASPGPGDSAPAEKTMRRSRACLECRALKVACVPTETDGELCKRCVQYDFECLYVSHRRGRKPKSRITPAEASALKAQPAAVGSSSKPPPAKPAEPEPPQMAASSSVPSLLLPSTPSAEPARASSPKASSVAPFDTSFTTSFESAGQAFHGAASAPSQPPGARAGTAAPAAANVVLAAEDSSTPSRDESSDVDIGGGGRGATFTFLNEDSSAAGRAQFARQQSRSAPVRSYSMRALLKPVASIPSSYLPEIPSTSFAEEEDDNSMVDPIEVGLVTEDFSRDLFRFFMSDLNGKWSGIFDPELDSHDSIRARSPFLLTSILCVASLFKRPAFSSDSSEAFSQCGLTHAQLSVHALDLAMGCFADGRSSLEAVQAFYLLSTWKDIDDSSSYLRMGFASKLSLDLELSSVAPVGVEQSREEGLWWRARQRMAMALFVQDRVQGYSFYRTHTLPLNDPLISGCMNWHLQRWARPGDAMLVASVQIRRIQSTYRDLITGSSSSSHESRSIMLDTIVPALQRELDDWYAHWSLEISRVHGSVDWGTTPQGQAAFLTMRIWQHSIQLHICSFALRDSLSPSPKDKDAFGHSHASPGMTSAAKSLAGLTALWPCIYSARSLLESFVKLPKAHVRTAPDTMSILPTLAATFLWRLTHVQGEHSLGQDGYIQSSLMLIREATVAFGSAVVDPHDTILLHARFLASVAVRIERQARAARKALLKTSSQPPTSGPTPVATRSSPAAPSASFPQNDVSLQLGADPIRPLFSSLRSSLQPPKPPSVVTDPATSPEQDLFPDMSFPAEWFSAVSPQQMADRPKYGDEPPPPLEGTIGGLNLDLDLNQFLGFDTQSPTLDGWGPWGEWAG